VGSDRLRWKELSHDFRLFMGFFGVCFVLFAWGEASIWLQSTLFIIAVGIIVTLSIVHRIRTRWRWPGVQAKGIATAILTLVCGGLLAIAALPLFPPTDPHLFAWYAGVASITMYNVLLRLRIVFSTEAAFLAYCGDGQRPSTEVSASETTSVSRKLSRWFVYAFFFAAWLTFLAFFWQFGMAYKTGTEQPTPERTEPLVNHGKTVYITPAEDKSVSILKTASMIGIPTAILMMFILKLSDRGERARRAEDSTESS
jgi:hypothetical protein